MHQSNDSTQTEIKRQSRSGAYLLWRVHVADALRADGLDDIADLFDQCGDPAQFFSLIPGDAVPRSVTGIITCTENPEHMSKGVCPTCHQRICPDCAHRDASRLLARYMPVMQKHMDNPRYGWRFRKIEVTCAISVLDPDIKAHISDQFQNVRKLFERLLKEKKTTIAECGFVVGGEFGPEGHKLHFHILYYGPRLEQTRISDVWRDLTGFYLVWIKEVGKGKDIGTLEGAVAEVLKYTTKFWKRDGNGKIKYVEPEIIPKIHRALEGTRRIRSWGLFYNIAEPEPEPMTCPECGAPLERLTPDLWLMNCESYYIRIKRQEEEERRQKLLNLKLGNKSPPKKDENELIEVVLL